MSSIKLTQLAKKTNLKNDSSTYVDLHLDIIQQLISNSNTNTIHGWKKKDIDVDKDIAAIVNSVYNILSTRPGQRFLLPAFGCNLMGYIGRPVSTIIGEEIGRTIYDAIRLWEPRVKVDEVLVISKPDENEYDVNLSISIPSLKVTNIQLSTRLTNTGRLIYNIE